GEVNAKGRLGATHKDIIGTISAAANTRAPPAGQSLMAARAQIPITAGRAEARNSQLTSGHVRAKPSRPTLRIPGHAGGRSQASTGRDKGEPVSGFRAMGC